MRNKQVRDVKQTHGRCDVGETRATQNERRAGETHGKRKIYAREMKRDAREIQHRYKRDTALDRHKRGTRDTHERF